MKHNFHKQPQQYYKALALCSKAGCHPEIIARLISEMDIKQASINDVRYLLNIK